jgi:hypothetical protein
MDRVMADMGELATLRALCDQGLICTSVLCPENTHFCTKETVKPITCSLDFVIFALYNMHNK